MKVSSKILIGFLMLMLFCVPAIGAVTITQDDYVTGEIVDAIESIDVTLSDVNDSLDYTIYGYVGRPFDNGDEGIAGEFFFRDVTDAGTYTFTLDNDNFPFSALPSDINISVMGYYPSNHTYIESEYDNDIATVTFRYATSAKPYRVAFSDHSPAKNEESDVAVVSGTHMNVAFLEYDNEPGTYNDNEQTLYLFITDSSLKTIARGSYTIGYDFKGYNYTSLSAPYDFIYHGLEGFVSGRSSEFEYNHTYCVFYGLRASDGFTSDNLYMETDETMSALMFSVDSLTSQRTIQLDFSDTYDFYGAVVTFHVYAVTNQNVPTAFVPGTLGQIAQDYGDSIGMPFFPLFIVFLIIGVLTSIPFSFAVRYELEMPNFVYVTFISIGVVLSYGLALLTVWMFVTYFAVLLVTLLFSYKDHLLVLKKLYPEPGEKKILPALPAFKKKERIQLGDAQQISIAKRIGKGLAKKAPSSKKAEPLLKNGFDERPILESGRRLGDEVPASQVQTIDYGGGGGRTIQYKRDSKTHRKVEWKNGAYRNVRVFLEKKEKQKSGV